MVLLQILLFQRILLNLVIVLLLLGHSTGMGHAPTKLLEDNVDASKENLIIIIPDVAASKPGNIWLIDILWNNDGELTELSTEDIDIE
jgi:hypothetical protein